MSKWTIEFVEVVKYLVEIEADTLAEAEEKFFEIDGEQWQETGNDLIFTNAYREGDD